MWRFLGLAFSLAFVSLSSQANEQHELWQDLKDGGKVVMMRHATVDQSIGESFVLDESCFTEKNLNEFGEQQAKAIAQVLSENHIKVGQVLTSPYCRTKDTAKLAFGRFEISPLLHLVRTIPVEKGAANLEQVRKLLSDYQGVDNLFMVSHRPNIADITNIRLQPAQMIVFEPLGDGLFDVLGVLEVSVPSAVKN